MKGGFAILVGVLLVMAVFQGVYSAGDKERALKKSCGYPKGGIFVSPKKDKYNHADSVTITYDRGAPSKMFFCDDGYWNEIK